MLRDWKFALRALARTPLFSWTAIVILALGIGVNTTIFSLGDALLLKPLPGIAAPQRLAWIMTTRRDRASAMNLSYPDYLDYREGSRDAFEDLIAFRTSPFSVGSGGTPERIQGQIVSGTFFPTLGVVPEAGRLLGAADDLRGAAQPVVVLSDRLWRKRFGASRDLVGQPIVINGRELIVVGIAPRSFIGPQLGEAADLWVPFAVWPMLRDSEQRVLDSRGLSWLSVMGRLRPGVTTAQAETVLRTVAARLASTYPATNAGTGVVVGGVGSPVPPTARTQVVPVAALLLTVTGLVLLIACANVANLLLARGAARRQEMGVRAALGASRSRLVRQLLIESMALAASGAGAGLLLALWAADLLASSLGPDLQGLRVSIDLPVLVFTISVSALSVVAFGLVPSLAAAGSGLMPAVRSTPGARGRSRIQGAFVVAQLALSLVLLLCAGMSVRALQKSSEADLGFSPDGVLTASYDLVLQNYPPERRLAFRRELLARVGALPGVTAVALANVPPLGGTMIGRIAQPSDAGATRVEMFSFTNGVGPGYFSTLGIPLLSGREFDERDQPAAPHVAIVNETFARRFWNDLHGVGRTVRMDKDAYEVIGVAKDSKYDEATEEPQPFVYVALAQDSQLDRETLFARTRLAPEALVPAVRDAIRRLDPALPVFDVQSFARVLQQRQDKQRAISLLLAAFGALALGLAAVGLYGVTAYAVTRRTGELGVRLALGATPGQLTRMIARDGLRLALVGMTIGAVLAAPLTRAVGALVFGIRIGDVAAFGGVCGLLVAVALAAALLAARRALRVDPITALRAE